MQKIHSYYTGNDEPATRTSNNDLETKLIAGQPGATARGRRRQQGRPMGPVGFLLESVHLQAAGMGEDLIIRRQGHADVDIDGLP